VATRLPQPRAERQFGPSLVYLAYSVYLVCPVLVWFTQTHETDQIDETDQRNQIDQVPVVDFSTWWWISTTTASMNFH